MKLIQRRKLVTKNPQKGGNEMSSEEEILGNATKCKKMETLSRNSLTHDEEAHDEKAEQIVNEVESQDIFRNKV